MQRDVLYVGADDSNHAGTSKGEIIVATFSYLHEDSIVRPFPNTKDYQKECEWMKNVERDFRFVILTKEKYAHSSQNLVTVVPQLIYQFLSSTSANPSSLKIYLDGFLNYEGKTLLRSSFLGKKGIEKVIVDNFIKKRRGKEGETIKKPNCPALVYYADICANLLFRTKTFEDLATHEKLVMID